MKQFILVILFISLHFFCHAQEIALTFDNAAMGDGN
jgi:hypothetical protein